MFEEDDILSFEEEEEKETIKSGYQLKEKWKIMIVDDEEEVHSVTKMALSDFEFNGQGVEFIDAYSGVEAKKLIESNKDVAVILLDVVMENDYAGLDVAKYIREELRNEFSRIVLRTGQPGQAPERQVILDYDINDYKTKTELTSQKLFTIMVSSIRAYNHIKRIDSNKKGLEKIISASTSIFELQSIESFITGVLTQITSLLDFREDSLYAHTPISTFAAGYEKGELDIIAGTGEYSELVHLPVKDVVQEQIKLDLAEASRKKKSLFFDDRVVIYFQSKNGVENMIYLRGDRVITDWDRKFLEIFCNNVNIAFDNIYLSQEIITSQKETMAALSSLYKINRLNNTEKHMEDSSERGDLFELKKLGKYSRALALIIGFDHEEADMINNAAPLHDVGRAAVIEKIINKIGRLEQEEWEVIKNHTWLGYNLLKNSSDKFMQIAAQIALEHHEKWDGTGYPQGLKGEGISTYARIVSLMDAFDSLNNKNYYRQAWSIEDILKYIEAEKGKSFEPRLVDAFLKHLDEFLAIRDE